MKLNKLIETVESGSAITSTDNFDIVPVKFGPIQRNILTRKLSEKDLKKKKKKKKRKKVSINWGPDAYAPYAGEGGVSGEGTGGE